MPGAAADRPARFTRAQRVLTPLVGLALFVAAIVVVHHEFRDESPEDVRAALDRVTAGHLALAVALTAASYFGLTLYDVVALRVANAPPQPYRRTALASFVSYALSYNLGFAVLTAGGARYRFYSAMGLSTGTIAGVVASITLTAWLGWALVTGILLVLGLDVGPFLRGAGRVVGVAFVVLVVTYLAFSFARPAPLSIGRFSVNVPRPRQAVSQVGVAAADWLITASIVAVLLPVDMAFPHVVGIFLVAHILGIVSNLPGGIGVFEGTFLLLAPADAPRAAILAGLLAYRVVYYLAPFAIATVVLAWYEFRTNRKHIRRAARAGAEWLPRVAPTVLAGATFLSGALLLLTGAAGSPAFRPRVVLVDVPELARAIAHVATGVAAGGLLAIAPRLADGERRARDAALPLAATAAALAFLRDAGGLASIAPALALLALVPARAFFESPPHPRRGIRSAWTGPMVAVLVASAWLTVASHAAAPRRIEDAAAILATAATAPAAWNVLAGATVVAAFIVLRSFTRRAPPTERERATAHR